MSVEENGIVSVGGMFDLGFPGKNTEEEIEEEILPIGKDGNPIPPKGEDSVKKDGIEKGGSKPDGESKPESEHPEAPTEVELRGTDYRRIISELSKRGVIPSMKDARFEVEEGKEVGFDEIEIKDDGEFCDILSSVMEDQKEEMLNGKIDASSVSDLMKKLIKADKSGANIVEILKSYDQQSAPVEKLDMDKKSDQLKVIRHYIGLLGLSKEDAEEFYTNIVNRGDDFIEARALKYKAEIDKRMDTLIEEETRRAEEKKKEDAERFRQFKRDLKTSIQAKYQMNDNMVQKVLDFALKADEKNPGVTKAIERARQMLMNPAEAPDLLLFLMNQDEYVKQKTNAKVSDEKKKIFKMIARTSKNRTTAPVDDRGNDAVGIEFFGPE